MTQPNTPGQAQTLAARRARTSAKHRRWAEELRTAGWTVTPPDTKGEDDAPTDQTAPR